MKTYKILRQKHYDERLFECMDLSDGVVYDIDLYTDGQFPPPEGADATPETWRKWLKDTFVGKHIEIERIDASKYFSGGKTRLLDL